MNALLEYLDLILSHDISQANTYLQKGFPWKPLQFAHHFPMHHAVQHLICTVYNCNRLPRRLLTIKQNWY